MKVASSEVVFAYHGLPSVFYSLFYLIASVVLFEALSAGMRTYAIKVRQMYYYIRVFDNKLTLVLIFYQRRSTQSYIGITYRCALLSSAAL
jgi:hypothetical protein